MNPPSTLLETQFVIAGTAERGVHRMNVHPLYVNVNPLILAPYAVHGMTAKSKFSSRQTGLGFLHVPSEQPFIFFLASQLSFHTLTTQSCSPTQRQTVVHSQKCSSQCATQLGFRAENFYLFRLEIFECISIPEQTIFGVLNQKMQ